MTTAAAASRVLTATLSGSPRARGRAHGELFGARARESGILDFYRGFCSRELFCGLPGPVGWGLDKLHAVFARRLSAQASELAEGFCEASGIELRTLREGLAMPDVLNFAIGGLGRLLSAPTLGCTSAAAWGPYTPDGRLLCARNLDFPGNGVWDRFPLVLRHRPDRGVPYVSIGTAGSVVDGITGINEEGVSAALHQHLTREVSPGGRPILDLGRQVLESARSIDDAVALCAEWPASSGWSVVLTHWKRKEAAVVQKTGRGTAVRRAAGGVLVHTNTFDDPALRSTELLRPAFLESSRLRRARAEALLEERKGRVEPAALASLLNDRLDPERGLRRAFGQAIHQPHTVTSVVLDPERGELWVAEGEAPVCQGAFRKLPLWSDEVSDETLSPADPLTPEQRRAYGHYLRAYAAWTGRRDAESAGRELAAAVSGDGADPIYRHMRGLLALRNGELETARGSFEAGAALPDIPHRGCAQRLWQARALDLLGRRAEALRLYAALAQARPVAGLADAAAKGLSAPYRKADVRPDFVFGDSYLY